MEVVRGGGRISSCSLVRLLVVLRSTSFFLPDLSYRPRPFSRSFVWNVSPLPLLFLETKDEEELSPLFFRWRPSRLDGEGLLPLLLG